MIHLPLRSQGIQAAQLAIDLDFSIRVVISELVF